MINTSDTKAIAVKICGLKTPETIAAAVAAGAGYVGLNFYPPSPRAVTPARAGELAALIPPSVRIVGVFVDPDDALLEEVLAHVSLDLIQLHGNESPERIAKIKALTGRPVLKAVRVANRDDVSGAEEFDEAADMLLFDAKAPSDMADALPGGNGLVFDWNLLAERRWKHPWFLSGGLDADNVVQAIAIAKARAVDVSSGVESAPGEKDPSAIKAFLDAVKTL